LNVAAAPAEVETVTPVFSTLPSPGTAGFNADYTTFAEEFRIRGSEAGPDQHANIISIANFLQVCVRVVCGVCGVSVEREESCRARGITAVVFLQQHTRPQAHTKSAQQQTPHK
jgi:hypothetical protein